MAGGALCGYLPHGCAYALAGWPAADRSGERAFSLDDLCGDFKLRRIPRCPEKHAVDTLAVFEEWVEGRYQLLNELSMAWYGLWRRN